MLFKDVKFMARVLRVALIALLVMQVLYVQPLSAGGAAVHADSSVYGLYIVHRYGNVTLLVLNKSALRYVGGFWVAVLGDIDRIDIAERILDIVGCSVVQATDIAVEDGKLRTLRGSMSRDVSEIVSALVNAGLRNAMLRVNTLSDGSLWLQVDHRSVSELGIEKLIKVISSATTGKRVVIQEVISPSRIPSYFDAQDMYEELIAIPCFTSLAETPYGVVIVFNQRCVEKIANQTGISLDRVIEDLVSRLRDVTPLLRKYIPSREFLVIFTNVYPSIPLVAEPEDISEIKTESRVSEQNDLKPWIISDYGGLVVIKVNRSLFKDLGNGYWLVVLPDMKYSEFDDAALNQVAPYLHIEKPEVVIHVAWVDGSYVVKANETKSLSKDAAKLHERIKDFLEDISHRGLTPAEMKLFAENNSIYVVVGGASKLDIDELAKLAHQYFENISERVVVIEKLGWLPPGGPYQRTEMLDALGEVPCFSSFGEGIYGTSIIINAACIEELAREKNMTFNEAVDYVVGEVKKLNPLIRKYLPWQEILIMIAKIPKLMIPVSTTSSADKPLSEARTKLVQIEEQSQSAVSTIPHYNEEYVVPHQLITLLVIIAVGVIIAVIAKHKYFY